MTYSVDLGALFFELAAGGLCHRWETIGTNSPNSWRFVGAREGMINWPRHLNNDSKMHEIVECQPAEIARPVQHGSLSPCRNMHNKKQLCFMLPAKPVIIHLQHGASKLKHNHHFLKWCDEYGSYSFRQSRSRATSASCRSKKDSNLLEQYYGIYIYVYQ